ncbi:MAG TPA: twin-arginine translocation pathway signal protein [Desulfuromonas sp.]|nr:twin-arginine translocation pathway signal protein [Desulfuromonas sp.]
MNAIVKLSRRDFLKQSTLVGGGLLLACYLPFPGAVAADTAVPFAPNAFLRIGSDGSVTIICHKSEMGQGVYTALPTIVAEELDCAWEKVKIEQSPVAPEYAHTMFGSMVTGGSTSVRSEWQRLAQAGATARAMLVAAAAAGWKIDPAACRTENGAVYHPDGRRLSYGQLATKAAKLAVPPQVALKDPARYRLIGRPLARLDSPAKINGQARFGLDVQRPGLLVAVIARPPVFGATLRGFNADKANSVPGVRAVVAVPAGVAVVADGFWPARQARALLEIAWDEGPGAALASAGLRQQFATLAATPGLVAHRAGDVTAALERATVRLEAEYEVPYLAHATMEPLNCTVDLKADGCDIWTGSQMQTVDRDAAARVAGLQPEQVRLHTTFLGGGFGRRANPASDFVVEAVQVAKAIKQPVKVIRTREDDMRAGYYRPCWYDRISAGLDADKQVSAWRHTIVGQSIMAGTAFAGMIKDGIDETSVEGAADTPYAFPNLLVDLHTPQLPVTVLWWRSVGHSHTAFVVESFLDEVAHAAGTDPVTLRRTLLAQQPRPRGVLELAASKAGWGTPLAAGRGRGIAVHASFGSYLAQVAEVSLEKNGRVRVHRVVCAIDCGRVVNPDTIAAQMESGIAFGLSAALHGAITLKAGRVEQGNFDDYPLLRLDEMPQVEVHIVPSSEAPGGVGEPGVPPIAPAVANALFALSGARVRSLPLTPEKVLAALAKG